MQSYGGGAYSLMGVLGAVFGPVVIGRFGHVFVAVEGADLLAHLGNGVGCNAH